MSEFQVEIQSSTRVFRRDRRPSSLRQTPIRTRLSIIDASCANFGTTGALWYFDPARDKCSSDPERLIESLRHVLDAFPHFEGRLRKVHHDTEEARESGAAFYNRIEICYDDEQAPGVQFDMGTSNATLNDVVPDAHEQAKHGIWLATDLRREDVFLQGRLANAMIVPTEAEESRSRDEIDPVVVIQVTAMADGGFVIGVGISHPLADAHALSLFVREWSQKHASLAQDTSVLDSALASYPFDPAMVDGIAAKIASGGARDDILEKALSAPMHRFDWWDNANAPFQSATMQPPEPLKGHPEASAPLVKGQRMDWTEWVRGGAVEHAVIRFSAAELEKLRIKARGERISTLDLLIAHIWSTINRARGFSPNDQDGQVFADISFGLRARLDPPLPANFIGSPLVNMAVPMQGHQACLPSDVPAMAKQVRKTVSALTPDLLAAHLYGLTQELTPQRVWQCFLGKRHTLITSWVHTGVHKIDFATGHAPRYVHPIMPKVDGCVQVIEATPLDDIEVGTSKWYANGVNVNVYLEARAMSRLRRDLMLQPKTAR